jgi:hypothetical protein
MKSKNLGGRDVHRSIELFFFLNFKCAKLIRRDVYWSRPVRILDPRTFQTGTHGGMHYEVQPLIYNERRSKMAL